MRARELLDLACMKALSSWVLVVVVALVVGCVGGKRGPRGTNVGAGSDEGGPWTKGGSPALVEKP
jgi:hypothetical protein